MPAKSKSQQRLFGMVHAYQKGKLKHAPASVKRIAKHISQDDAKHFAKTRHKGLPEKKAGFADAAKSRLDSILYTVSGRRAKDIESARRRQRVGKALMALGLLPMAVFGTRGAIRARKALRTVGKDLTSDLDHARAVVAENLARKGKVLPEYAWAASAEDMPLGGFRISFEKPKPIPVFTDKKMLSEALDRHLKGQPWLMRKLMKLYSMNTGPHFGGDYVYAGNGKISPKVLMHELGHAKDMAERGANALKEDQISLPSGIREWLRTFVDPDSSRLVQMESRAWENGGIERGDALREAALDTYRNAAQMRAAQLVSTPVGWAGIALGRSGRRNERRASEK